MVIVMAREHSENADLDCTIPIRNISEMWDRKVNAQLQCRCLMTVDMLAILLLDKEPKQALNMKVLERMLCATQPDITRMALRLEKKEYVIKYSDPEDKRAKMLGLTEKGKEKAQYIRKHQRCMNDAMMDGFTEKEQEQFVQYLLRVQENSKKRLEELCQSQNNMTETYEHL